MGRTYLIMVVLLGLFGSLASNFHTVKPLARGDIKTTQIGQAKAQDDSASSSAPVFAASSGETVLERSPDGHFYADVRINGATVHALIDTGATSIALSREDARNAGLPVSIGMEEVVGHGADGDVHGERVVLETVALGTTTAEGMPAIILNSGEQTLLGQSFLAKFPSVRIEGDRMVLQQG